MNLRSANLPDTPQKLARKASGMKAMNFDRYLEEQLKDPEFTVRFAEASEAWEVGRLLRFASRRG